MAVLPDAAAQSYAESRLLRMSGSLELSLIYKLGHRLLKCKVGANAG